MSFDDAHCLLNEKHTENDSKNETTQRKSIAGHENKQQIHLNSNNWELGLVSSSAHSVH